MNDDVKQALELAEQEVAHLRRQLTEVRGALGRASTVLRMVGDDYPGSSCHDWCHRAADDADSALLGFIPPPPMGKQ
jgi:hypothetical protein